MKNRKFQLDILKNLIREEIKLQNKKNLFEDVASTVTSTVTPTIPKLEEPIYSNDGMTLIINNINGYQNLNLTGLAFDDFNKGDSGYIMSVSPSTENFIKINWKFDTKKSGQIVKNLSNFINKDRIKFNITNDVNTKTINLNVQYRNDKEETFTRNLLHNYPNPQTDERLYTTDEKLDILIPKNNKLNVLINNNLFRK